MILKPFDPVSKKIFFLLTIGQAVLLLLLWSFSPINAIPTPFEIARAWDELARNNGLLLELYQSVKLITMSIVLASLISFSMAYLTTAALFKPVFTWMTALRFLGFAGITFLFTMWTADGSQLKLALLTFGMAAFQLTGAISMVNSITQQQVDYARTLRLKGWRITYELAVRGKLDEAMDIIRQNAAIGWTLLAMVEGLTRSEGGIGALLLNQSKHLKLSEIFAIQLTILAYGILQDYFLRWIRLQACPYIVTDSSRK